MKVFAGDPIALLDVARAIDAAGKALDLGLARRLAGLYGVSALEALDHLLANRLES